MKKHYIIGRYSDTKFPEYELRTFKFVDAIGNWVATPEPLNYLILSEKLKIMAAEVEFRDHLNRGPGDIDTDKSIGVVRLHFKPSNMFTAQSTSYAMYKNNIISEL